MGSKKKKEILIKCTGADAVPVQELNDFQGDLKVLSDENYKKFKNELLLNGFSEPISVWVILTLIEEGYIYGRK